MRRRRGRERVAQRSHVSPIPRRERLARCPRDRALSSLRLAPRSGTKLEQRRRAENGRWVKKAALAALRQQLALIERGGRAPGPVLPFGVPAIDAACPAAGLPAARCTRLAASARRRRRARRRRAFSPASWHGSSPARPVLWCLRARRSPSRRALRAHGLAPERLILARAPEERGALGDGGRAQNAACLPPWSARSRRFRDGKPAAATWPPRPPASPASCCAAAGRAAGRGHRARR